MAERPHNQRKLSRYLHAAALWSAVWCLVAAVSDWIQTEPLLMTLVPVSAQAVGCGLARAQVWGQLQWVAQIPRTLHPGPCSDNMATSPATRLWCSGQWWWRAAQICSQKLAIFSWTSAGFMVHGIYGWNHELVDRYKSYLYAILCYHWQFDSIPSIAQMDC